jgi:hypothetical protein
MKIKMYLKTRDGSCDAEAVYDGEKTIVLAGAKIRNRVSPSVQGGKFVKRYLDDPECVSEEGIVLKDCTFNSPSIAAMFVNGNASNGYRVWKVEKKKSLGDYLEEKGLR